MVECASASGPGTDREDEGGMEPAFLGELNSSVRRRWSLAGQWPDSRSLSDACQIGIVRRALASSACEMGGREMQSVAWLFCKPG